MKTTIEIKNTQINSSIETIIERCDKRLQRTNNNYGPYELLYVKAVWFKSQYHKYKE